MQRPRVLPNKKIHDPPRCRWPIDTPSYLLMILQNQIPTSYAHLRLPKEGNKFQEKKISFCARSPRHVGVVSCKFLVVPSSFGLWLALSNVRLLFCSKKFIHPCSLSTSLLVEACLTCGPCCSLNACDILLTGGQSNVHHSQKVMNLIESTTWRGMLRASEAHEGFRDS
jgi:hypothetical protein